MSGGVSFNPEIEIFYRYTSPDTDTTSQHSSDVSSTPYESHQNPLTPYPISAELSSSCSSLSLGNPGYPPDNGHVYHIPSPSKTQYMHASRGFIGRYEQEAFSPPSHPSVASYGITESAFSTSAHIDHSEPSEKHFKYYDSTGLHIALSSNLELLDYDISVSPENGNSIAETEVVSPYLDKPATQDHSKELGIQHPALPIIIWIRVATDYITVSNVLHGMYDVLMRPSPDNLLGFQTAERQFYIKGARETRIREGRDEDKNVKWIDWMPNNRRITHLSKGPECRKDTWTIILENDPWNYSGSFTSRL